MDEMNQEPKIGVYVCQCGTNISKVVDCDGVAGTIADMPGVTISKSYKYMCSNPGQEMIAADIKEHGLERVVVAACSPHMHERTFRNAVQQADMNPYFLEIANIREQCSWVHDDKVQATAKAKDLVTAAVDRVVWQEPLERMSADMCPNCLVIGGGVAGMTAALDLADAGGQVYLVERADHLGGQVSHIDLTAPYLDSARDIITERLTRVMEHPKIEVLVGSQVQEVKGFVGNFEAMIETGDNGSSFSRSVDVGSVVVATGYKTFDASRVAPYGYGVLPNVITSLELEKMLREGRVETKEGKAPQYVTLIHCVGSRSQEYNSYCSRVCCAAALKYAHEIKSSVPGAYISDVYIDMHAFGKGHEDLYRRTSEANTLFLMYGKDDLPLIRKAAASDDCGMLIEVNEILSGESIEVPSDLVVLMVGMEARDDCRDIARLVNISVDKDGWFIESHPKLDPVATTTDGIYIAGACQAPKDIPDSVAQARAAAARIMARIAHGTIEIDAVYAEIDAEKCSGCRMCNALCPYAAIEFDEETHRSFVRSALCKACGACVAACPSSAIKARGFTDEQIFAQIEGVLA